MNTFSKLYDTELHNQEIKSNKRTLMGFCWFFLTLLLVWVLTMINFFHWDLRYSYSFLLSLSIKRPISQVHGSNIYFWH